MQKLGIIIVIIISLALPAPAAEKEIRLATLDWEPYVGKELDRYGFTSEIVTEAFKRVGYTVQIDFMPWARVLKMVERGKYAACYPGYYSDERAQIYALSEAFAHGPLGFYKRKDAGISYTTLYDLKAYKIGIVRGYVNTAEFDKADYLTKQVVDSDIQNLRKLVLKRIDLVVIDKLTAQNILSTLMADDADTLEFLEPPLEEKPLHVMFSREVEGYEQNVKDFNKGLKELIEDGTVQEIMKRHGF